MEDFNEYIKHNQSSEKSGEPNVFDLVSSIAKKYDGKNTNELLKAIYKETLKGKQNGTLTNADIDRFASMISPMLDDKKRKALNSVVNELKKI